MNIGKDIEVQVSEERYVHTVPRGYDAYLVHFSNVRLNDILDLRQEQPWSKIVGVSGAANVGVDAELRSVVDNWRAIMLEEDYIDLIKNPRREVKAYQKDSTH